MSRPRALRSPPLGFTLVELLAVIAIIALLAALLFPAMGAAQARVKTARCASNLKQQGAAAMSWSADNEGRNLPARWQRGAVVKIWTQFLFEGGYVHAKRAASALAPIQAGGSVFWCPEGLSDTWSVNMDSPGFPNVYVAPVPEDPITFRPWRGVGVDVWYGLHCWGNPVFIEPDPRGSTMDLDSSYIRPTWAAAEGFGGTAAIWPQRSYVTQPSRKVHILDGNVAWNMRYPHSGGFTASARHNGKRDTNVLLYDGHVETVNFYKGVHSHSTQFLWQVGDHVGPH